MCENPILKLLFRPITTGATQLPVTCSSAQKSSVKGPIGCGFDFHWLKEILSQTLSVAIAIPIAFDGHFKTFLLIRANSFCDIAPSGSWGARSVRALEMECSFGAHAHPKNACPLG